MVVNTAMVGSSEHTTPQHTTCTFCTELRPVCVHYGCQGAVHRRVIDAPCPRASSSTTVAKIRALYTNLFLWAWLNPSLPNIRSGSKWVPSPLFELTFEERIGPLSTRRRHETAESPRAVARRPPARANGRTPPRALAATRR